MFVRDDNHRGELRVESPIFWRAGGGFTHYSGRVIPLLTRDGRGRGGRDGIQLPKRMDVSHHDMTMGISAIPVFRSFLLSYKARGANSSRGGSFINGDF